MRDETQLDAAFRAQGTGDPAAELAVYSHPIILEVSVPYMNPNLALLGP